MCLNIYYRSEKQRKELLVPKKATKNIKVYKIFRNSSRNKGDLLSPFQHFVYNRGFIYYQDDKDSGLGVTHGWSRIVITRGLHSYKKLTLSKLKKGYFYRGVFIECIIPKGSLYYENSKEYASNQLLIPYRSKEYSLPKKKKK